MINYLIHRFPLKQRLFAGMVLSGGVTSAIVVIALLTFENTAGNVAEFAGLVRESQVDLQMTAKISDIQRQAVVYTYKGHASAAEQVAQIHAQLQQQIDLPLARHDKELTPVAALMRERLRSYFHAFELVRQQRERQEQLINVEFRDDATAIRALFEQLIDRAPVGTGRRAPLLHLLNQLLLVEVHAFRYFDSLDAVHVRVARERLDEVLMGLRQLQETGADPERLNELASRIDRYRSVLVEAVQRTRGFLYLVNVVMAADAYEILYQSRVLSRMLAARTQARETAIRARMSQASQTLLLACGALLLALVLLSYLIGRSITDPIRELARTFRALSLRQTDAVIPVSRHDDELGELTRAAEAFSDKNRETETLLARSRELTDALRRSKLELERSNEELEQFVYTVSHDLKSPLVTSMGFIGMIQKLASQGQYEAAIGRLDKVVRANERMSQLISDLLELSRVGRIDSDRKPVDLDRLVREFARTHHEQLLQHGFTLDIGPGLPTIEGNESRLLQLFENLLSNALKYVQHPEGPRLTIGAVCEDARWKIWFRDNGPGIAPEYHQKIFGLFYRLDNRREGTGVGLAIARKVMKFHDGDIWVESQPGSGATFWISFPRSCDG